MSKTSREIIDALLEYAVKFGEMNEEPNNGACWDAIDGARKYLAETAGNGAACIVVDYDDRHDDAGDISPEDFERKKLGISREEFDKTATYIW